MCNAPQQEEALRQQIKAAREALRSLDPEGAKGLKPTRGAPQPSKSSPVQSSPVHYIPVQSSPVQSSPLQSSPVQSSP